MTRFSDWPIRRKLTLATVAASGLALLLASTCFILYDYWTFDEVVIRRLGGEAEIVGFNSATAIVFGDPGSAAKTLAALRSESDVLLAAVYSTDGRLFAHYRRDESPASVPSPILPSDARQPSHVFDTDFVTVVRPIAFEGARVGSVVIRSDLQERAARMRRYMGMVLMVALPALLVSVLVSRVAHSAISKPILNLAETSRLISERGDFSVRAVPGARDEVGVLVATFNEMLEGLQHRDRALRQTQAELERRVAERTELHRQAEEASRLKDQFLATLSHELRTPLNAIVGWSSMLVHGQLDAETQARAMASIDRNARAQSKLINDVLDVSRIVSGKLKLNARPIDLPVVIHAAVDSVRHAALARQIRIDLDFDSTLAPISADPDRLQQVLWNLLSNSLKFTPAGGRVAIEVCSAAAEVAIVVRDDGSGIPQELVPHVFERFRQADASITRPHGGLGLGLAIVRHLVELHGGTVCAESEGAGKGARFTVRLPILPGSAPGTAARGATHSEIALTEGSLNGICVLVVGDEPDSRQLIETVLVQRGARVTSVPSVSAAIAHIEGAVPDVVVSDLEMADLDGYFLLRTLRACPAEKGGRVPAIAVSARVGPEDRRKALASGFQLHVAKPINPNELVAALAGLVRR